MPKTNYSDPENAFPRLEVELFTIDDKTYFANAWLWEKASGQRRKVMNQEAVGSISDAHEAIQECAGKYGAALDADDITVR